MQLLWRLMSSMLMNSQYQDVSAQNLVASWGSWPQVVLSTNEKYFQINTEKQHKITVLWWPLLHLSPAESFVIWIEEGTPSIHFSVPIILHRVGLREPIPMEWGRGQPGQSANPLQGTIAHTFPQYGQFGNTNRLTMHVFGMVPFPVYPRLEGTSFIPSQIIQKVKWSFYSQDFPIHNLHLPTKTAQFWFHEVAAILRSTFHSLVVQTKLFWGCRRWNQLIFEMFVM